MSEAHLKARFAIQIQPEIPDPLPDEFSVGYWLPVRHPVQEGTETAVRECLQNMIAAHASMPRNNRVAGSRCNVLSCIQDRVPIHVNARLTQQQIDSLYIQGWIPFINRGMSNGTAVPWGVGSGKSDCVGSITECLVAQQFLRSVTNVQRAFIEAGVRRWRSLEARQFHASVMDSLHNRLVHSFGREELHLVLDTPPSTFILHWTLYFPLRHDVHLRVMIDQSSFTPNGKLLLLDSQNLPSGHRKFLPDFDEILYVDTTEW